MLIAFKTASGAAIALLFLWLAWSLAEMYVIFCKGWTANEDKQDGGE